MTVELLEVIAYVRVGSYLYPVVEKLDLDDSGLINAAFSPLPEPHIVVNQAAWSLPEHVRLALVGHEIGHDYHNHWGLERTLDIEAEADAFAVAFAGLAAVRQLLTTMLRSLTRRGYDSEEVEARLQRLPEPEAPRLQCPKRLPCGKKRRRKGKGGRKRRR